MAYHALYASTAEEEGRREEGAEEEEGGTEEGREDNRASSAALPAGSEAGVRMERRLAISCCEGGGREGGKEWRVDGLDVKKKEAGSYERKEGRREKRR